MPSIESLAPDQRAVVQLVLRQGRSYADLAGLLGISEEAVRKRAHAGVRALGEGLELDSERSALLTDYLLGQQGEGERAAIREVLERDADARAWARRVAAQLGSDGDREPPEIPPEPESAPEPESGPAPRAADRLPSSKLGGALLIGGLAIAVVAVLLVLFVGGDDDGDAASPDPAAQQAQETPQARSVGEIRLRPVGESKAAGVMRLVTDGTNLGFEIQAERMPRNRSQEAYAVWFVKRGGSARRLGFTNPVREDGLMGIAGPTAADQSRFASLLAQYDQVVVSRESDAEARRPGRIVLRGTLPRAR
jgi:hypothetical protein